MAIKDSARSRNRETMAGAPFSARPSTGDGGKTLVFNESTGQWDISIASAAGDFLPDLDVTYDLGSPTLTWAQLYIDSIFDRAGTQIIDIQNRQLSGGAWTVDAGKLTVSGGGLEVTGGDITFPGVPGGTNIGDAINSVGTLFVDTIQEGAAIPAGGIWDLDGNLSVVLNIAADDVLPNDDVTHFLGSALFTYAGVYTDDIFDRAGTLIYDVQNAAFKTNQRLEGDTATFGAAGAEQARIDSSVASQLKLLIAGTANSFVERLRIYTADHGTVAHDLVIYDGDGTTERMLYDDSTKEFEFRADVIPLPDLGGDLGNAGRTWENAYVANILDEAGNLVFDTSDGTGPVLPVLTRFTADPAVIFGTSGDTQMQWNLNTDYWSLQQLDDADVATDRIRFFSGNHATQADDFEFLKADGTSVAVRFDMSGNTLVNFLNLQTGTILPISDGGANLGNASLSFFDVFTFNVKDEAGNLVFDTSDGTGPVLPVLTRFTADPAAIFGAAGDSQLRFVEGDNFWTIQAAGATNSFLNRIRLYTDDDLSFPGDILFYDGNGSTVRGQWDESLTTWFWNGFVYPGADVAWDLGSAIETWRNLFVDSVRDRAGVEVYDVQNASFKTLQRFEADPNQAIFGAAGDTQLRVSTHGSNAKQLWVAGNDNVFWRRVQFMASDYAGAAHDIIFYDGDGTTATLQWDDSLGQWLLSDILAPLNDNGVPLGDATRSFSGVYTYGVYDEAGNLVLDSLSGTYSGVEIPRRLAVTGGGDLGTADGSGVIQVGASGGANVAIDHNEIQARSGGAAATLFVHADGGAVTLFNATDGTLTVNGDSVFDQRSTTGAAPVLTLDQADVDEDFFKFIGTSDTSVDRALVDAANFTAPGSIVGWIKVNVQDDQVTSPIADGDYYIPFYSAPTVE